MTLPRAVLLSSLVCAVLTPISAAAGTVRAVSISHGSIAAGQAVTATVSGSNPCGAANVDWGDGTAITYAITGLPTAQSHTYAYGGAYTILARGMGNCDGEATASLKVSGPPPPASPAPAPAPSAVVTGVSFSPSPATAREGMTIVADGHGSCAFVVDFGDGNQQDFHTALPARVTHTYGAAGDYRVIVGPVAPCSGKFTEMLQVQPRGGARITDLQIAPFPAQIRQGVTITVLGSGSCRYRIDFGDGNNEERTHELPDRVPHVYSAADTYTIAVTASTGCSGSLRRALTVFPAARR